MSKKPLVIEDLGRCDSPNGRTLVFMSDEGVIGLNRAEKCFSVLAPFDTQFKGPDLSNFAEAYILCMSRAGHILFKATTKERIPKTGHYLWSQRYGMTEILTGKEGLVPYAINSVGQMLLREKSDSLVTEVLVQFSETAGLFTDLSNVRPTLQHSWGVISFGAEHRSVLTDDGTLVATTTLDGKARIIVKPSRGKWQTLVLPGLCVSSSYPVAFNQNFVFGRTTTKFGDDDGEESLAYWSESGGTSQLPHLHDKQAIFPISLVYGARGVGYVSIPKVSCRQTGDSTWERHAIGFDTKRVDKLALHTAGLEEGQWHNLEIAYGMDKAGNIVGVGTKNAVKKAGEVLPSHVFLLRRV